MFDSFPRTPNGAMGAIPLEPNPHTCSIITLSASSSSSHSATINTGTGIGRYRYWSLWSPYQAAIRPVHHPRFVAA